MKWKPNNKGGLLEWFQGLENETRSPLPEVAAPPEPEPPPASVKIEPPKAELMQRFEDEGEIGRGGMSSIRRVRDVNLRRRVAMKVLDPELAKSKRALRRFVEEAQITGQLDHPNIPPIHEMGTDPHGTCYFTQKLIRGRTLHQMLYDRARPPGSSERLSECLEIFLKVCDAVSFAHSRGVIHRDIKPANIMVGAFGEVYLLDWGLAKLRSTADGEEPTVDVGQLEGDPRPASVGGVVGTPAYMSPEQAGGATDAVDERSDVFGLGAVLYHIVTGEFPYDAPTFAENVALAKACAYTPPEDVLVDLGTSRRICGIIKRAMAASPDDRYQTVADLKRHVQRFLQGGLHLPRQTFAPGEIIVREGAAGDAAYIITRGQCEAFKAAGGERRVLRRMGPGTVFGETALLSGLPRTASVEAVDEVTVLVVTRATLEDQFGPNSWVELLMRSLAQRFHELDERVG